MVWISHHLMGGGGGCTPPPPLTRFLEFVARNEKMRSKAREKSLRNYVSKFFARVNTEVDRGHQKVKFSEFPCSESVLISETILGRRPGKKRSIAPELLFRQHVTELS